MYHEGLEGGMKVSTVIILTLMILTLMILTIMILTIVILTMMILTMMMILMRTDQEDGWWGVTTANRSLTRLSCRDMEEMWFTLHHHHQFIIICQIYFGESLSFAILMDRCKCIYGHLT